MKNFLQKYWINALGITFLFIALLYFLKFAAQNDLIPFELRLVLSTVLGLTCIVFGFRFIQVGQDIKGQVIAGLGTAILYATVAVISFSEVIQWSNGSLILVMIVLGMTLSGVSIRYNQRLLFVLAVFGGLMTPFIIEASPGMDLPLFIYVLFINLGAIYACIYKGWKENLILAFFMTIGLFASYYFFFYSDNWVRPFIYATIIFIVFLVGFTAKSFEKKANSMDLLYGAFNGINYIFWSQFILGDFELSYHIPFTIVGVLFLTLSMFHYLRSKGEAVIEFSTYFTLALTTLGIVGNDLSLLYYKGGLNYVIVASVWLLMIISVYIIGRRRKDIQVLKFSIVAFLVLVIYWFFHAWDVEWIAILGVKYIPFINPGAMVWIGLITLGFVISVDLRNGISDSEKKLGVNHSAMIALLSHLLIGGLLTIQIMNLWEAYDMVGLNQNLILSLCWFSYALIIFIWNKYTEHKYFKTLGAIVLIVSTLKVVFWDLYGDSSMEKVIFLLILGGLTLLIGRIHTQKTKT